MLSALDAAILWDWLALAARWLHIITAMAWIGSSFYFIALDLGLRKPHGPAEGVHGEEWQVHGGGFYHIRKYLVAPPAMPDHLTWFKWESYSTWLSGLALMMILYWAGAEFYLIDRTKLDLELWQAIGMSALSLTIGWLVYDSLCKSRLGNNPTALMVLLFVLLVAMSWGYDQIFTGRAALLHIGAFTATIMTANVFLVIIPNQKVVVADLKAGRSPNPEFGRIGKLRSTHNNYLTLPVIFLMISNHYPLTFATEYNWIICSLVFLMGVTIRHYFNTLHARKGSPHWTWALTALIFIVIMWLSALAPPGADAVTDETLADATAFHAAPTELAMLHSVVETRCVVCHSTTPSWGNLQWPPKNIILETEDQLLQLAREVYLQSGMSVAMPPANLTGMLPAERALVRAWHKNLRRGELDPISGDSGPSSAQ